MSEPNDDLYDMMEHKKAAESAEEGLLDTVTNSTNKEAGEGEVSGILDTLSPEDMDQEIQNLEAQIAAAQRETEGKSAEPTNDIMSQAQEELSRLDAEIEKLNKESEATGTSQDTEASSIYVGNVDYGSTPDELRAHFQGCGVIQKCTILTNKHTGHPMGYAYIQFEQPQGVTEALLLNDSLFRGRTLKVMPKRHNVPFMSSRARAPRRPMMGYPQGGFSPRRMRYDPYYNPYPRRFSPYPSYGPPRRGGFRPFRPRFQSYY